MAMEVAAGKAVLDCLLGGAKITVDGDKASKQAVRRDLPFLKEELAAIQSFLMDADDERNKHKVPVTKVKRVRTLSYDVDDCIQDATVHLEKPSRWQLPHTMRERKRIAEEMKRLRAQIEDMGQRSSRYQIAEDPNSRSVTSDNRARRADKPEVNRMLQLINSEDSDLKVIAVWGTSGNLEQTSIVRAAYEDPDVKVKFPCRAWVRVMQPFNPTEFIQGIVRQFHAAVGVEVLLEAEKTARQLAQEFNRHVSKNAYLIVLNELNTIEEWDRIKTCFPNNKKGSRIIVSTKQAEVATLSVGYESAELMLKELAPDQILYAFQEKVSQKKHENGRDALETRRTMAITEESNLVGRAREKNDIIKLITSENSDPVISLWGIAGIGKTTLIRDVYDSQEISGMFGARAYVTIVRPFNLEELLTSIIMQLSAGRACNKHMVGSSRWRRKTMTREQLWGELGMLLDGTRYLIVLEDVFLTIEWALISNYLFQIWSSSKIIVTTRFVGVANCCSRNTESTYELKALEYNDGLNLFTRKVFGKTIILDQQYPDLVEHANLILRRCKGVPLAILINGASLTHKTRTESEWSKFSEPISELEMNPENMTTITVFRGYNYLQYQIKPLFLYLPIFPGDYKIRRTRLISRWTAEGYSTGAVFDISAEETLNFYFMELIRMSMIVSCQLSIESRKGIHSCQVHDIISSVAMIKSREENLVFKLESGCSQHTQGIVRHLAVSSSWEGDQDELEKIVDMSRLRSITVFGKWRPIFSLDKMRLLRVLDLEDTSGLVDHHLEHIGKLLHLRYLSLRGCGDIYHLPDSVGNLRLLETLDVKGTKITQLPKTTTKLMNLQHVVAGADDDDLHESMSGSVPKPMRNKFGLMTVFSAGFCVACCAPHRMKQKMDIDGDVNRRDVCTACCCSILPALGTRGSAVGVAVPRGINKLKTLLTLRTVNVSGRSKTILQDIKGFTRLRKFGVAGINRRNCKELWSAITNLKDLESLSVWSDGKHGLDGCFDDMVSPHYTLKSLKLYGRLGRLPLWILGLDYLVKLKLRSSCLCRSDDDEDDVLRVLGKLRNLSILILLENSFEGEELHFTFHPSSFPKLLVLQIQSLDVVRRVEFAAGATPRLEVLRSGVSSDGDCRFYGLQHPPCLREIVLGNPGRNQERMAEHMREQLAMNPNRPVRLRMGN